MQRILLLFCAVFLASSTSFSQTVVLDYETAETSATFQFFGGNLEGTFSQAIANPNPTGINTSSMVLEFKKASDAPVWGGGFADPTGGVDLTGAAQVCADVHVSQETPIRLKLENSGTVGNWENDMTTSAVNEWGQVCWDITMPTVGGSDVAAGNVFPRIVFFMDWDIAGSGTESVFYIDNVVVMPAQNLVTTTVLDYETTETSATFQIFGGNLEGTFSQTIANPNPTGVNTSSMVEEFKKASDAPVWGGGFADPMGGIDLINAVQVCADVHIDHVAPIRLKLENSGTVGNWENDMMTTVANEWEQVCWDITMPTVGGTDVAAGNVFPRIVFFMDWDIAGNGTETVYYIDNVVVKSSSVAPEPAAVTFQVDMSEYTGDATNVYLRGTFNNFSEDNVMTAGSGDIWTTTIDLMPGAYDYKFWISGTDTWESFTGLEECVANNGGYINRAITVTEDATLDPVIWNSCYVKGDEVMISFELGTDHITVDPQGIWVAGGGNFDAPGGRFKMNDDNNDGIYTLQIPRQKGFSSFYTFANGNCPDYSCKEDISGLECSDPDNFDDRFLAADADLVISTCFGSCSEDATACLVGTKDFEIVTDLFEINPTLVQDYSIVTFNNSDQEERQINVVSTLGNIVNSATLGANINTWQLDATQLTAGIYFVQVQQGFLIQTTKILIY